MVLSWDVVREQVEHKGWELVETKDNGDFLLVCKNGHKFVGSRRKLTTVTKCSYCRGIKITPQELIQKAKSKGFTLQHENISQAKEDRSGNFFVPKRSRLTFICKAGHVQTLAIKELEGAGHCAACNQERANTAFSRSEEIIAKILTYNKVKFQRNIATDKEHGQLKLDFVLPDYKIILQYDGAQHKYGRTSDKAGNLEVIQQKDEIRNQYAKAIGYKMIRLNHYQVGRKLTYAVAAVLPYINMNPENPVYDEIVKEVYNYASKEFGWDSYDKIKFFADIYKSKGRLEAHKCTGRSLSNLQRDYNVVYGKPRY